MSLADSLFSQSKQQVLRILFADVAKTYYLNEIVRMADMGKGTIKRELDSLTAAGVLKQKKQGNQLHFQANDACPIFKDLKSITDRTFGIHDVVLNALSALEAKTLFAFIFGSVAKGREQASSDIDVLLVGENISLSSVLSLLASAEGLLLRKINPTILTPKEFEDRIATKQSFMTRVSQQDKLWLWGEDIFREKIES